MWEWATNAWTWFTAASSWAWFAAPFEGKDWWEVLNSGFVGTVISSVVGVFVATNVGKVAKETGQATALEDAKRAENDASVALGSSGSNTDAAVAAEVSATTPDEESLASADGGLTEADNRAFATASMSIRRLKDYVDALTERCRDGRTRRKYENMSRRDYRIRVAAVAEDGGLKSPHVAKLLKAFGDWRGYSNGRVKVPSEFASQLQDLASRYRVTAASPSKWKPERIERAEAVGQAQ